MTIIAIHDCQLNGRIYRSGDKAEYDGEITERIAYNFSDENGNPLAQTEKSKKETDEHPVKDVTKEKIKEKIEAVVRTFNREQLLAKLDELGVTYKPNNNHVQLARHYLRAQGEID